MTTHCQVCGSRLHEAHELLRMNLSAHERRTLRVLLDAKGKQVHHSRFNQNLKSVQVEISRLRAMMHDEGQPWWIKTGPRGSSSYSLEKVKA